MMMQRRHWRWALALVGACVCIWMGVYLTAAPEGVKEAPSQLLAPAIEALPEQASSTESLALIDLEGFIRGSEETVRLPVPRATTCSAPTKQNVLFIGHYAPALPRFEQALSVWRVCTKRSPKRVVIVSPDHQHQVTNGFAVGDRDYAWQGRVIGIDETRRQQLHRLQEKASSLFVAEHGVAVPLIAAARVFPSIKEVLPLVVSSASTEAELRQILVVLREWSEDPETLILVSVDFSHYLPLHQARVHDQMTRRALELRWYTVLWKADDNMTDFGRGLWLLLSLDPRAHVFVQDAFSTVDLGGVDGYTTTFMTGWLAK